MRTRPFPADHLPRPSLAPCARARSRWRAAALVLLVTAVSGACREGAGISTTEPEVGPGTVYALASANEITLPASFTAEGRTVVLRKGALTLGNDSTFIFSYAHRTAVNNGLPSDGTVSVRGQFRRNGTALALLQQSDTMFTRTYAATTVSLSVRRATVTEQRFVFVR